MGGNAIEPGRSTASRLLALLAAFTPSEPVLTLSALARASGLPVATAHRLVAELVDWGALERRSDGLYQVGLRLWEVGSLAPVHRDLRSVVLPFMEDLYEATHENVQLAVRDGLHALFLEKISGRASVDTLTEVGGRLPLHATAVGKVLLAYAEPDLLHEVLAGGLARRTPHTITAPGLLAETLRQVRRTQLAYSREEMTLGACSVAAPIFGPDGRPAAALAIVARSHTNLDMLARAVRTAALGASRTLAL